MNTHTSCRHCKTPKPGHLHLCAACWADLTPETRRALDVPGIQADHRLRELHAQIDAGAPLAAIEVREGLNGRLLPAGTRVYHSGQEWAHDVPGGTGEIVRHEPFPGGCVEYLVRCGVDFARRPGPRNPETREAWWPGSCVRRAATTGTY